MTTTAYNALLRRTAWGPRDRFGYAHAKVDPRVVLRAAEAPKMVLDAIELAVLAGCDVAYESHSCHVGGSESVVVFAPVPDVVRAALDAVDASGIQDATMGGLYRDGKYVAGENCRWADGRFREDGREHWSWTLDIG